jgi:hypothetical protein
MKLGGIFSPVRTFACPAGIRVELFGGFTRAMGTVSVNRDRKTAGLCLMSRYRLLHPISWLTIEPDLDLRRITEVFFQDTLGLCRDKPFRATCKGTETILLDIFDFVAGNEMLRYSNRKRLPMALRSSNIRKDGKRTFFSSDLVSTSSCSSRCASMSSREVCQTPFAFWLSERLSFLLRRIDVVLSDVDVSDRAPLVRRCIKKVRFQDRNTFGEQLRESIHPIGYRHVDCT